MEDLHRAILLFYFAMKRRMDEYGRPWIGYAQRYMEAPMNSLFPGYHVPCANAGLTSAELKHRDHDEPHRTEPECNSESPGDRIYVAESSEDTSPITGLEAVDTNTEILESFLTTCPARTMRQCLKILGETEPRESMPKKVQELLHDLKKHHQQPDFDARLARHQGKLTHISFERHSATFIVEECNFSQEWPLQMEYTVQQVTKDHYLAQQDSEDFDEQRKGMLVSFDWRNCAILNVDNTKLFRSSVAEARKTVHLLQTIYRLQDIENATSTVKLDSAGINNVRMLTSCGLRLFYCQFKSGKIAFPHDRKASVHWLCQYSPIMTRALDLAVQHAGKRLLVYVDDPWIQCVVVGLFTIAGFVVGTYGSSHTDADRDKIVAEWNDLKSDLDIFVANVNTPIKEAIHSSCDEVLVMGWFPDPERMVEIFAKHDHPEATIHILKVKNSYHDQTERDFIVEWIQGNLASANNALPQWVYEIPVISEICWSELAKTLFHQPFNRYAWIAQEDNGIAYKYHSDVTASLGHVFSMVARLIIHQEQDQDFWSGNSSILVQGCILFNKSFGSDIASNQVEDYLTRTPEQLREEFLPLFKSAMQLALHGKNGDDDEDDQAIKDEDEGAGPKRKASDDGGRGGKKPRIVFTRKNRTGCPTQVRDTSGIAEQAEK